MTQFLLEYCLAGPLLSIFGLEVSRDRPIHLEPILTDLDNVNLTDFGNKVT